MARKTYRYSLNRSDAKLAGVCSTIGEQFGIDPTFIRVGFVAAAILISFKLTLALYAGLGYRRQYDYRYRIPGRR